MFFRTPPAARWSDLIIQFLDGHRVAVRVSAVTATLTYAEMGMSNRRNGNPTKQWELLRDFAHDNGTMSWKSPAAARENRKRRESLAKNLKTFFRIDGDPILLTPDRKGSQTVFTVEPD